MRIRTQSILLIGAAMVAGAVGGALLSPAPVGAVAREIIELQQSVSQLLQGQKAMQSAMDEKFGALRTLVEQSLDSNNKLNTTMVSLQRSIQDTQATVGARMDTMGTQVQGLSDNLDEVKTRLGKLDQQLATIQSTLQSIDAKLAAAAAPPPSGGAPSAGGGNPTSSAPAVPPADILYNNALRDVNAGNYDLAKQEFQDYLKNYPNTDYASNAQFYLGEIAFAQGNYKAAIQQYDLVLDNYPKSFKLPSARYKKAMALLGLEQKTAAIKELREVVRRYPNTAESRLAQQKLRQLGVSATAPR